MTIAFRVDTHAEEIGTQAFLHAFFSTIIAHLEPEGQGTIYPVIMLELYSGKLDTASAATAIAEALEIREQLKAFPPDEVIWDIKNRAAHPPWGRNISKHITDLSNYFVTSRGRDLFEVLLQSLERLRTEGGTMTIEPI